jgi:hypothetical protein
VRSRRGTTGGESEACSTALFNAALLNGICDAGVIDGGCDHALREFGAVLTLGDVVVTADSLALHIATALGVPAVALVGFGTLRVVASRVVAQGVLLSRPILFRACRR